MPFGKGRWTTPSGPLSITVSIGVLSSKDWAGKRVEELLHQVDLALYQAKEAGRNCVRLAKPRGELTEHIMEVTAPVERRKG